MIPFLDMDGVIVNFVKGAMAVHKIDIPLDQIEWDFYSQAGFTDKQFWAPLGREFWANLEWTAEGKALLEYVESRFKDVIILTSPCATEGCMEGKMDWIRQHIPKYKRKFLMGPAKHFCASKKHLLIDDMEHNIDQFEMHGGHGLLVPRTWNRHGNELRDNQFNIAEFCARIDAKVKRCSTA